MLVKLSDIVMFVNFLQPLNAELPMLVTLSGIHMLVKSLQHQKAPSHMLVTLSGIIVALQPEISSLVSVFIIALHISRLSYTALFSSTLILVNPMQVEKAYSPILVTFLGIFILVNPKQPLNAAYPMIVTLSGIFMLAIFWHPLKA